MICMKWSIKGKEQYKANIKFPFEKRADGNLYI